MRYQQVTVLVPSHSIEDFPTDLAEKPAASLLNAFAVAFHPTLLAQMGRLPNWQRAEDPPENVQDTLFIVPLPSDSHLPVGWKDRARQGGAVVVSGLDDRAKLIAAVLEPLKAKTAEVEHAAAQSGAADAPEMAAAPGEVTAPPINDAVTENSSEPNSGDASLPEVIVDLNPDAELVADFMALGTCWLMLELLTRHMHHFASYDEVFLGKSAVEAARATMINDAHECRDRLRACFDLMAEARERFYPVDCYMIDLCLLTPESAHSALNDMLLGTLPVNYLLKAADAEVLAARSEGYVPLLKEAWARGAADVVGGDHRELPVPLVSLESTLRDLQRGRDTYQQLFGRRPTTWARRRYGHSPLTPQIAQKFGYHSALHVLLDDGIYPDREQSKLRWDGCDSSSIDAYSRIPLAADSSATYLRLPQRLAETMQSDQVAALVLARWPDVKCPIFHDLKRIQKYAPVLGRAVTFEEYFQHSDASGSWGLDDKNYLSPFLLHAVARRQARPISRFVEHYAMSARLSAAAWCEGITQALYQRPIDRSFADGLRDRLDTVIPDEPDVGASEPETRAAFEGELTQYAQRSREKLKTLVMSGAGSQPGFVVFNPLSFGRRVVVELPAGAALPAVGGCVKATQEDVQRRLVLLDIPAAGFAWFESGSSARAANRGGPSASTVLAEGLSLRNEFFEVQINPNTGGLQRLKNHGRAPNRLSQQLAYRFPQEKVVRREHEGQVEETRSWYSEMKCQSSRVTSRGPVLGEVVTEGSIVDPVDGSAVATFQQTYRVWIGRPYLELEIEVTPIKRPEGDPWSHYIGSRFAWNDAGASVSWSLHGTAQPFRMERMESPDFIEIASESERTTILPLGLPFHRTTGMRMLDSVLVVDGEEQRRFRFVIGVDQNFPYQAALDLADEPVAIVTTSGPPRSGPTGWFYHVDSRCVQVLSLLPLMASPPEPSDGWEPTPLVETPTEKGFALRIQETEGRYQSVAIELFRRPTSARLRDFQGRTTSDLPIEGDGVRIEFSPFGIVEVEFRFG